MFHTGDIVYSPYFGRGEVGTVMSDKMLYPVCVYFDNKPDVMESFTLEGQYYSNVLKSNKNIMKEEEMMLLHSNFTKGDRVYSKARGFGVVQGVTAIRDDVEVLVIFDAPPDGKWAFSFFIFNNNGRMKFFEDRDDEAIRHITDADIVNYMADPDSPDYYKTARVEPIDLMRDLMTPEQFEGFLWGNIIKYAYRYGKKEDKAKTAGKIAQYAAWLKEVNESADTNN